MTDNEKAAALLYMLFDWMNWSDDGDMEHDVACALGVYDDRGGYGKAARAELRRLASVLRGDAVGAGPAAPEGVRKNCWTCRWNDVEDGNTCSNSAVADHWISYTSLDDNTLMPHPDADGCPGWGQR